MFLKKLIISFENAFKGVYIALIAERNMKIHAVSALLTITAGWFFHVTAYEWIILVFAICLVIAMEMINTAIEASVDLCTEEFHPLAKKAKDVAAGAVLICAIGAAIIGLTIFIPYLQ